MTLSRMVPAALAVSAAFLLSAAVARAAEGGGDPLALAVAKGAQLFENETFGGNGKTCATCHVDGGKSAGMLPNGRRLPSLVNAAAIFPRYNASLGQVLTLEGQVQRCVHGALGATPPDLGSPELVALVAYLGSIARSQPVDIGGAPK